MDLMLAFLLAMSVTMALIPPLMQAAARWQFLDAPEARKVHTTPVPRVGGIAMAAGTLLALLLSGEFAQPMPAYLAGVLVLLGFGVWDDRVTLSAGPKLLGQVIAVLIIMVWGDVTIATMTLTERHELPSWIAWPLTFVFLIGVTNAINLADGLDGLAGGTTLLSLSALALLAFTSGAPFVGVVAIVIVGAILGFLRYNTHPARVFMGDGGSQILGFSAAVLAVVLTQDESTPLSSALPLLLLGIPIIDTLMVMTQRMLEGRSPLQADRNHIHHRLLALGFDHHEAVMGIYLLQASLFVTAWYLRYESDLTIIALFAALSLLTIGLLQLATTTRWRLRPPNRNGTVGVTRVSRSVAWLRAPSRLPRWSLLTLIVGISAYVVSVGLVSPEASSDVKIMAACVALGMLGLMATRWRQADAGWVLKAAVFVALVMAVYFDRQATTFLEQQMGLQVALFVGLAIAVVIRFRLASDGRFRVTPLDILVIFIAVAVPNLPGSVVSSATVGESIAKLVVLMYGVETLFGAAAYWWRVPSLAALVYLAVTSLHGGF
ncbi:glycosyltransferase family 4 protein [Steroidobacter sp.]|uniref:glycosyltransferase family 4 protein n=1 Tax=Steroidobacter sp. TaxID=1978227 RepID=UPI001A3682A6|nr:MraY family glycosyltransferase [Steroidobacter sp.]MBL8267847.1 undecaprenyl/decaprenyl-phosphate alpha-N-acetylglucosaminyl 1-phosphate transferase [Steroidobacter sp.]